MNKNLRRLLSCGTAFALCAGIFTSCNDDDDYETRISVLETAVGDLKTQLGKALTTGASVTGVVQNDNGTYTINLSDGQTIQTGGASGAGSDVKVTVTDTDAIITVNGEEYKLPLGANISSLTYAPDYQDGEVRISDGTGAVARFIVRPELPSLDGAEFTIAESHELKSRVLGEEDFKVTNAELKDGLVNVTIICKNGDIAGQKHTASLQLKYHGTVIGSNYFTINVDGGFSFVSEAIDDNITVDGATKNANGIYERQFDGKALLAGVNLADYFKNVPAGAEYVVAAVGKQPGGPAQEKQALLAASLSKDGNFNFASRPGTSFNSNEEQKGFLVNVVKDEVVIAKAYVTIDDPLAGKDVKMASEAWNEHVEWGTHHANADLDNWTFPDNSNEGGKYLEMGVNSINIPKILLTGELSLAHGNASKTLKALSEYANDYVYATKNGLVLTDEASALCKHSAGVRWYNRQLSVASSNRRNWSMSNDEKKAFTGGECNGEIIGGWDGISPADIAALGITIHPDGTLSTDATYPGYALRMGIGVELEYDYGTLPISGDNSVVYIWIGRRNGALDSKDIAAR